MDRISALFPEYVRLADGLRTGEIPSTPENEAAYAAESAKVSAYRMSRPANPTRLSLIHNTWALSPVAAACWAVDAQVAERL